ncbi:MAG: electron transport complex subunit RsxC [Pseudomonadota bacterium]
MSKTWRFPGGLHLPGYKEISTTLPVAAAAVPRYLIFPLQQHIGAPAKPLVAAGDKVLKGQMIAKADGYVSAPVHASSSGTVVAVEERPIPHPSGLRALCIVVETDGRDEWIAHQPVRHYTQLDPSALRNVIREAGIVGLGGAGFPTFIKLNRTPDKIIDTLILNGAECEPYITCDDMLMRERPEEIIAGLFIMRHALQARACIIGIEDNKPEAAAALARVIHDLHVKDVRIALLPTRYPAGGEKQLIQTLTGKEVPSNGLPLHIGVVCHNVGTAVAVHRAVNHGEPLISRYVTVSGPGIEQPRNLDARLGTPMRDLIAQCGAPHEGRFLMGGPMMGFALHDLDAPVIKTTNCILAQPQPAPQTVLPCIRCGACAEVCPASLLPQQLYWHARAKDFSKAQAYNLFDCIECGCCNAVCPSHIPLVDYYRFAKTEIAAQEQEKRKADVARRRHEFRLQRLEREKQERAARQEQKKAAASEHAGADAVQAAIARAQSKAAQQETST